MRQLLTISAVVVVVILFSVGAGHFIRAWDHRKDVDQANAAWQDRLKTAKSDLPIIIYDAPLHSKALIAVEDAHARLRKRIAKRQPDSDTARPPDQHSYEHLLLRELATLARTTGNTSDAKAYDDAAGMLQLNEPDPSADLKEIERQIEEMDTNPVPRPSTRPTLPTLR